MQYMLLIYGDERASESVPREQGPDSDIDALNAGRIVVTPLRYDRTDGESYAMLARALPRG